MHLNIKVSGRAILSLAVSLYYHKNSGNVPDHVANSQHIQKVVASNELLPKSHN